MSTSQSDLDLSGDSGHNHLKPFLTALVICAVIGVVFFLLTGLPQ